MLQEATTLANSPLLDRLPVLITAVGGLGTAAYGIVDATKSLNGGLSNRGFSVISKTMATLLPDKSVAAATHSDTSEPAGAPALSLESILVTLKSNWVNGVASDDQRAIAKSLVKLRLNSALAGSLGALTGVDPTVLSSVATKIGGGVPLDQNETDVYGRFDLVLTTLLDQAYQRADQQYRNTCKIAAMLISVGLSISGTFSLGHADHNFLSEAGFWQALMVGLLATPLAPIAKDLSSAVQAGAKAATAWAK